MTADTDMLIRALALTAGLALSAFVLLTLRVPASERVVGTDVALEAVKPGELVLEPRGRFASARDLRPGGPPVRATLTAGNDADLPLGVAVSARPGAGEASRALWLEVRARGRVLARGPVPELGRFSRRRFSMTRRGRVRLEVAAWLPRTADGDVRARLATARLRFRALAAEGAR